MYVGHYQKGIYSQLILYIAIGSISWSRLITEPIGGLTLIAFILCIHLFAVIHGYFTPAKKISTLRKRTAILIFFPIACFSILITIFLQKSIIFGFEINKISSTSMLPTLYPGDYILSNTWAYKEKTPSEGDIVIFRTDNNATTIKRVQETPEHFHNDNSYMFYLVGDNPFNSMDSRYLGLIEKNKIQGQASYIIYPHDTKNLFWERIGKHL